MYPKERIMQNVMQKTPCAEDMSRDLSVGYKAVLQKNQQKDCGEK